MVTEEEYNEFYKAISNEYLDPLAYTHFTAEGEVTFRSILFIPQKAPVDMFSDYGKRREQVKLFVRRVFITDDFQDMLPKYLSFVRGLVDSDDLPLNVSREQLQQHKLLKVIKKKLVRKILDRLKKLAGEEGAWSKFWKEFSTNVKLGCMEDHSNRSRLSKLLRFFTTKSEGKQISLEKYVSRMQETQKSIYYMTGKSMELMQKDPSLKSFKDKDLEVLMLNQPVDEYTVQSLRDYFGKKFVSIRAAKDKEENDEVEEEGATISPSENQLACTYTAKSCGSVAEACRSAAENCDLAAEVCSNAAEICSSVGQNEEEEKEEEEE